MEGINEEMEQKKITDEEKGERMGGIKEATVFLLLNSSTKLMLLSRSHPLRSPAGLPSLIKTIIECCQSSLDHLDS
ncbi:hypothetical protein BHE74_00046866, partial [Ensete ventricosum]